MASTDDVPSYYFIDDARAYRGPVTKATLHLLFATEAITPNTYLYAEHLNPEHSWMRLKRLPELLAQLSQPIPTSSPSGTSHTDATPAPLPEATKATAAQKVVPKARTNPTAGGAKSAPVDIGDGASAAAREAAGTSAARSSKNSAATQSTILNQSQPQERLYAEHFAGAARQSATDAKAGASRRGFFGLRRPAKSVFGQPLEECSLDPGSAVPQVLVTLRELLVANQGLQVEGIFRVSPSQAILKVAQKDADSNRLSKLATAGPECIATLIKLWFRSLPESILSPGLEAIVDGPPATPAACAGLVAAMADPHRSTMRWLLRLCHEVVEHESANRMNLKALITVFAPNLVDPPPAMPPMLALEVNRRVALFIERLLDAETV